MIRYFLARGDRAGSATIVEGLPNVTCANPPPAVQIATLYMKTYCTACKREGFIAPKGPRHTGTGPNGKPWALSGDINVCGCNPPPVFYAVRAMKMSFTSEEVARMNTPVAPAHVPQTNSAQGEYTHEKRVASDGENSLDDHPELICPNMTNAEFYALVLRLRDKAIEDVDRRLSELSSWGRTDQAKVELYFGPDANSIRSILEAGLARIRAILGSLSNDNFERYSEENLARTGCIPRSKEDDITAAAVCGPDGLHRIFIYPRFCRLPEQNLSAYGVPLDGDSKLLTLIHEVSHFQDGMGTRDIWYSTKNSRWKAADANQFCIENAENIAAYTVGIWDDRI